MFATGTWKATEELQRTGLQRGISHTSSTGHV